MQTIENKIPVKIISIIDGAEYRNLIHQEDMSIMGSRKFRPTFKRTNIESRIQR